MLKIHPPLCTVLYGWMDAAYSIHPFNIDLLWDSVLVFRLQISMACCATQRMNAAYIIETKPTPFCYQIHTKVNTHMQTYTDTTNTNTHSRRDPLFVNEWCIFHRN